jgi:hypothetical protein
MRDDRFPEPTSFNGPPDARHDPGRSHGKAELYGCRECAWTGRGMFARRDHFEATGHTTLWAGDPRVKRHV